MTAIAIITLGVGTPWPDVGALHQDLERICQERASSPGPECQQEAAAACQAQGATQASTNPQQGSGDVFGAHTDQARPPAFNPVDRDLVAQLRALQEMSGIDTSGFVKHILTLGRDIEDGQLVNYRLVERVRQLEAIAGSQAGALAQAADEARRRDDDCQAANKNAACAAAQVREHHDRAEYWRELYRGACKQMGERVAALESRLEDSSKVRVGLRQEADYLSERLGAVRRALDGK